MLAQQVLTSSKTPIMSLLLEGLPETGKTALAAFIAKDSEFPYVRIITPELLVGYSEVVKCNRIAKVFEDAYKSSQSMIIIDDVERIIEFMPNGYRYSAAILQTLLVYLKKVPPKDKSLFIVATTSQSKALKELELYKLFKVKLEVQNITEQEFINVLKDISIQKEVSIQKEQFLDEKQIVNAISLIGKIDIGIKKLFTIIEISKQGEPDRTFDRFIHLMTEYKLTKNKRTGFIK